MKTKRNKMLSVRASEEEINRIKELAADLMKKHHYLKEADVIRELIGLEDTGLITPELRRRLLSPGSEPGPSPNLHDEIVRRMRAGEMIELVPDDAHTPQRRPRRPKSHKKRA